METNKFGQNIGDIVNGWHTRSVPTNIELKGRFCTVVALNLDIHSNELFTAFNHEHSDSLFTYLPFGPFDNTSTLNQCFSDITPYEICFSVIDNKSSTPLGVTSFHGVNPEHGIIEISALYSKALQKTTAGTEAMYLMLSHAFDTLSYRRCQC